MQNSYEVLDGKVKIAINLGKFTYIDLEDLGKVLEAKGSLNTSKQGYVYVYDLSRKEKIRLHRLIMQVDSGL